YKVTGVQTCALPIWLRSWSTITTRMLGARRRRGSRRRRRRLCGCSPSASEPAANAPCSRKVRLSIISFIPASKQGLRPDDALRSCSGGFERVAVDVGDQRALGPVFADVHVPHPPLGVDVERVRQAGADRRKPGDVAAFALV